MPLMFPVRALVKSGTSFFAQLDFQGPHLAAQRRLGDVQHLCGPAEAAELGDLDEVFELLEVHEHPSTCRPSPVRSPEGSRMLGFSGLGGRGRIGARGGHDLVEFLAIG